MNFTPQVESAEISDADLDTIAGGNAGGAPAGLVADVSGGLVAGVSGTLTAVAHADVWASVSPTGVSAGASIQASAH